MSNCACCGAAMLDPAWRCTECGFSWNSKLDGPFLCVKTDRQSSYDFGRDEHNRPCIVATHHGVGFEITHNLYWTGPTRLVQETRRLIEASNLPYFPYETLEFAMSDIDKMVQSTERFPDFVVLERDQDGGAQIKRLVCHRFQGGG